MLRWLPLLGAVWVGAATSGGGDEICLVQHAVKGEPKSLEAVLQHQEAPAFVASDVAAIAGAPAVLPRYEPGEPPFQDAKAVLHQAPAFVASDVAATAGAPAVLPRYEPAEPPFQDAKAVPHQAPAFAASDVAAIAGAPAALPRYEPGEQAEVISLQGGNIGDWIPCTVTAQGGAVDSYSIHLPSAPEGKRDLPSIPAKYLRKGKPDVAGKALEQEAERFAATLKRQLTEAAKKKADSTKQQELSGLQKKKELGKWMAAHGMDKLLAPAKGIEVKPDGSGLSDILRVMFPPSTTTPQLSAQEEMLGWLRTQGADELSKDHTALRKLAERYFSETEAAAAAQAHVVSNATIAKELHQKAPEKNAGSSSNLRTSLRTSGPGSKAEDASVKDELELVPTSGPGPAAEELRVFNGTWQYGTRGQAFSLRNVSCVLHFEGALVSKGPVLRGEMRREGEWFVANVSGDKGQAAGAVRFRLLGQEPEAAVLNFRDTEHQLEWGQVGWSGDLASRRIAHTSDQFPGKCANPLYGCKCKNGSLVYPPVFSARPGDDAEVFQMDGSGWYRCSITGYNKSTGTYNIFVPQGPAHGRFLNDLPPDWLRRVKKAKARAGDAATELMLKRSSTNETSSDRRQVQSRERSLAKPTCLATVIAPMALLMALY